jgi:Flp pilus assembly protein TadB
MFALLDGTIKAISILLGLLVVALMILGAPMGTTAGFAMLIPLINWPLIAYKRRRQRKQEQPA